LNQYADEPIRKEVIMELEARAGTLDLASLAHLSHELRTPLNAVLGFASLMASDDADPLSRRQRDRLKQVVAAGEHLLAMVNEALNFASGAAGMALSKPGAVALSTAVPECIAMLAPMASQAGVAVHWESHEDDGVVWADQLRLRQVLLNLLSNGVKYNHRGGWVRIAGACKGEQTLISVRDNGLGIPPDHVGRLFRPLHRAGRETSGIEGTGLGLVQVKLLVEQMGGTVECESMEGRGSEFRVLLPRPPLRGRSGQRPSQWGMELN